MKITSIGTGAFGFALLHHLHEYHDTKMQFYGYDQDPTIVSSLRETHKHPYFHRQHQLHPDIIITQDTKEAVSEANIIFLAIPSQYTRQAVQAIRPFLSPQLSIVNTSKALDYESGQRLSEVVAHELPNQNYTYYALAGGTNAVDFFHPGILSATIANTDLNTTTDLANTLSTPQFKLSPSTDLIGVEYAGAFKNIVSVITGMIAGMDYSFGTQTFVISKTSEEIKQLVLSLGGQEKTFSLDSQCWGNDMIMSALGETRNREFGKLIGQGYSADKALETLNGQNKSVESVNTFRVLRPMIKNMESPILKTACKIILEQNTDPKELTTTLSEL